jgi:hypothetical protein
MRHGLRPFTGRRHRRRVISGGGAPR